MRIAVNLTWMTPGRVGGSEEYLTRQLMGIEPAGFGGEFDVELFVDRAFRSAHPELAERFATAAMPPAGDRRVVRIGLEHTWLVSRTRHADVVHHGGGTAPLFGAGSVVLTVHDLQYRTFPHYFSSARRRYLDAMMPRSVRRARVVAVPTSTVRESVVDAFGVAPEHVVVVPHGVPDVEMPGADRIASVRSGYGIGDRPYVTYPAITHPHKAHRVVIEMLDHLDDDTVVVLVGGAGAAETDVDAAVRASGHADRVVRTGRVPAEDRDALIAGADALVFPSEFEGFGAPVVEAMALDTPVVCSSAPALVEVVGDAGIIVPDAAGSAWADAVEMARTRRDDLIERGRVRRTDFTVEASGRAIARVWREAAS